jgi:hypothetical protein
MLALLMLSSLAGPVHSPPCLAPAAASLRPIPADSLRALYASGTTFEGFLAAASQRREQWESNYAHGSAMDATLVARARAVPGPWRLLVVAVDSCSDSVSTIPYLARLVEAVDGLEMRIVLPEAGQGVQAAHRTPDGRAATPTVVLLDAAWDTAGCLIERPRRLRAYLAEDGEGSVYARKMAWYARDAGHETVTQVVEMLEAAAGGGMQCD